jgi:hypothetical protein
MVKEQPELFQDIYGSDGNIIPVENLSKVNELTGAGVEYITSVAEYIYTHYLPAIKKKRKNSTLYDDLPKLEWEAFLEIASGGITGQVERIERTVMQYIAKPKMVFMIDMDGHLHTRWPFILDFDWGGPGKLDAKQAYRLANLNKTKRKRTDGSPRLPIKGVTIMAAKPLFETFFKKDPSTYSFPTGMYAKMFHAANTIKRQFVKTHETALVKQGTNLIDTDTHVSAYARYARYIMRHNNLTAIQMKNKNFYCVIRKPSIEFLKSIYPSLISINGRKERHIERIKFSYFMANAQIIYQTIEDFKIYPVLEGLEERNGETYVVWTLYTDQKKAMERSYEVSLRINARRTGKL